MGCGASKKQEDDQTVENRDGKEEQQQDAGNKSRKTETDKEENVGGRSSGNEHHMERHDEEPDFDDIPPPEDDGRHNLDAAEEKEQQQQPATSSSSDQESKPSVGSDELPIVVTPSNAAVEQAPREDSPPPPDDPHLDSSNGLVISPDDGTPSVLSPRHKSPGSSGAALGAEVEAALCLSGAHSDVGGVLAPTKRELWIALCEPMPSKPEQETERRTLWRKFHTQGPVVEGSEDATVELPSSMSVAKFEHGCRDHHSLQLIIDPFASILHHACTAVTGGGGTPTTRGVRDDDTTMVEFVHLRRVLLYLQGYMDLHVMFQEVDASEDRRVDEDEFTRSLGKLTQWGVAPPSDPSKAFQSIDVDDQGIVMFEAFADWALQLRLAHEAA